MATDRANLRTRARIRADQDNSGFPDDTQMNFLLDEGAREVFGDLVGAGFPADYTTQNITANGAASYALNSGNPIFGVVAVYQVVGSEFILLRRVKPEHLDALRSSQGLGTGIYPEYEIRVSLTSGPKIELFPVTTQGTIRVDYVTEYAGFANDADVWRGPARSDEMIVVRTAIKALRKEGEERSAAALEAEYQRLFEKVVNQASWLDMRNPPTIRDVYHNRRDGRDLFDYPVVGPGDY